MEEVAQDYAHDLVIKAITDNAEDFRNANKMHVSALVYVRVPYGFFERLTEQDLDELNRQDILLEVITEGEDL